MAYTPVPAGSGGSGTATAVRETSGPTVLTVGAIADGELLVRAGATLVGTAVGGGTDTLVKVTGSDTTAAVLATKLPTGGDLTWTTNSPGGAETRTAVITNDKIVNAQINSGAAIALSKLATQAALSVVTNATNGAAVPTAVAAGTDHYVFRRSGTALSFGLLINDNIDAAAAIAHSKLANVSAPGILGKFTLGAGAPTTLLASAGVDGQVPTIQADGSIAWETPAGGGAAITNNVIPIGNGTTIVDSTLTLASNLLTHAASSSGASVALLISNTSNTASSIASIEARVAGATADNPKFTLGITGGTSWSMEVLNASSDVWALMRAGTRVIGANQDGVAIHTNSPRSNYSLDIRGAGGATVSGGLLGVGTTASATWQIAMSSGVAADCVAYGNTAASTTAGVNRAKLIAFTDAGGNAPDNMVFGSTQAAHVHIAANGASRILARSDGNVAIWPTITAGADATTFGSGTLVMFIGNTSAAPSGNPTAGGLLYVESGALKYRGSGGTVTTLGNA